VKLKLLLELLRPRLQPPVLLWRAAERPMNSALSTHLVSGAPPPSRSAALQQQRQQQVLGLGQHGHGLLVRSRNRNRTARRRRRRTSIRNISRRPRHLLRQLAPQALQKMPAAFPWGKQCTRSKRPSKSSRRRRRQGAPLRHERRPLPLQPRAQPPRSTARSSSALPPDFLSRNPLIWLSSLTDSACHD
jgi:hypothetical protein